MFFSPQTLTLIVVYFIVNILYYVADLKIKCSRALNQNVDGETRHLFIKDRSRLPIGNCYFHILT